MQPRLALHKEHQQNKIEITTQLFISLILLYAQKFFKIVLQSLQNSHITIANAMQRTKTKLSLLLLLSWSMWP